MVLSYTETGPIQTNKLFLNGKRISIEKWSGVIEMDEKTAYIWTESSGK